MDKDDNKHTSAPLSDLNSKETNAQTGAEDRPVVSGELERELKNEQVEQTNGDLQPTSETIGSAKFSVDPPENEVSGNPIEKDSPTEIPVIADVKNNKTAVEFQKIEKPSSDNESPQSKNPISEQGIFEAENIMPQEASLQGNDILSAIKSSEESLKRSMGHLLTEFKNKLRYDQAKDEQIDTLHNELQEYKKDLVMKAVNPLINGIIKIYIDICKQQDALPKKQEKLGYSTEAIKHINSELQDVLEDIEEVFQLNSITVFRSKEESKFDVNRQRVLEKVATQDGTLVDKVARHVRPGFESTNKVLKKELIDLYVSE